MKTWMLNIPNDFVRGIHQHIDLRLAVSDLEICSETSVATPSNITDAYLGEGVSAQYDIWVGMKRRVKKNSVGCMSALRSTAAQLYR